MKRQPGHSILKLAAAAILVSAASPAFAHLTGDGHSHGGFATGFAHPIFGLDHVLAMVAVGLWAAQRGGRMLWALPAAFVGVMALGSVLGMAGVPLPLVESGIAASVLVLGLLIATTANFPAWASLGIVGVFALCHGHAHGTELPAGGGAAAYMTGFALATALLHGAGIGAALGAKKLMNTERTQRAIRISGGAVAAAGALMIAGIL